MKANFYLYFNKTSSGNDGKERETDFKGNATIDEREAEEDTRSQK